MEVVLNLIMEPSTSQDWWFLPGGLLRDGEKRRQSWGSFPEKNIWQICGSHEAYYFSRSGRASLGPSQSWNGAGLCDGEPQRQEQLLNLVSAVIPASISPAKAPFTCKAVHRKERWEFRNTGRPAPTLTLAPPSCCLYLTAPAWPCSSFPPQCSNNVHAFPPFSSWIYLSHWTNWFRTLGSIDFRKRKNKPSLCMWMAKQLSKQANRWAGLFEMVLHLPATSFS